MVTLCWPLPLKGVIEMSQSGLSNSSQYMVQSASSVVSSPLIFTIVLALMLTVIWSLVPSNVTDKGLMSNTVVLAAIESLKLGNYNFVGTKINNL